MSHYRKKDSKDRHAKLINGATKLALNFAILAGFGALIWYGYLLFIHKVDPLIGSIALILGIAIWVILIIILRRRYKRTNPSFKLTTFSAVVIVIILTFAGVIPIASYKDNFVESCKTYLAEQAGEEEIDEAEKAEMAAAGVAQKYDFYKEYVTLFNQFRQESGVAPLVFTPELNELANQRLEEISVVFTHEGAPSGCGENIARGYSDPTSLLNAWAASPSHRMNMLLSTHTSTGFATDGFYSLQLFK